MSPGVPTHGPPKNEIHGNTPIRYYETMSKHTTKFGHHMPLSTAAIKDKSTMMATHSLFECNLEKTLHIF